MPTNNEFEYEIEKSGEITICKYLGDCEEVTVPSSIDGHPVTRLNYYAFDDCRFLKKVTLSENLTKIGSNTFRGRDHLEEVVIPKSVTRIDLYAFSDCASLTSVTIPEGVARIEQSVFSNCSSLTSIYIPSSIIDIVLSAFYGCISLESIVVAEDNPRYRSVDGVLFDRAENKRIFTPRALLPNCIKKADELAAMTDKEILSEICEAVGVDYRVKKEICHYGFCGDGPLLEVAFEGENVVELGSIFMTTQALELCSYLRSLKVLNICYSDVDKFPDSLCELSKLEFLNLYSTQIKELPENFGELTSLTTLELGGTEIAELPESACNLYRLKKIRVQHSGLKRFPDNIGKLPDLKHIDFHGSLVEELPKSLVACKKLRCLWGWGAYGDEDESRIPPGVTENIMANFGETSEMSHFARFRICCHNHDFAIQIVLENSELVQIWNDYDRLLEIDDKTVTYYYGEYIGIDDDGNRYLCDESPGCSGSCPIGDDRKLSLIRFRTQIFWARRMGSHDVSDELIENWIPQMYEFCSLDVNFTKNYADFYAQCKKEIEKWQL